MSHVEPGKAVEGEECDPGEPDGAAVTGESREQEGGAEPRGPAPQNGERRQDDQEHEDAELETEAAEARPALRVELDGLRPLLGAVRPAHPLDVGIADLGADVVANGDDHGGELSAAQWRPRSG